MAEGFAGIHVPFPGGVSRRTASSMRRHIATNQLGSGVNSSRWRVWAQGSLRPRPGAVLAPDGQRHPAHHHPVEPGRCAQGQIAKKGAVARLRYGR